MATQWDPTTKKWTTGATKPVTRNVGGNAGMQGIRPVSVQTIPQMVNAWQGTTPNPNNWGMSDILKASNDLKYPKQPAYNPYTPTMNAGNQRGPTGNPYMQGIPATSPRPIQPTAPNPTPQPISPIQPIQPPASYSSMTNPMPPAPYSSITNPMPPMPPADIQSWQNPGSPFSAFGGGNSPMQPSAGFGTVPGATSTWQKELYRRMTDPMTSTTERYQIMRQLASMGLLQ
jgi:hypothetical protein